MASTYLQPVSKRRRVASVGLTILVHVLIVLLLLNLAPRDLILPGNQGSLTTFDVGAPAGGEREPERKQPEPEPQPAERAPVPRSAPLPPPVPQAPPRPAPAPDTSGVIWLDRDTFAASDITGRRAPDQPDPERPEPAESAQASKAPYGPSLGPGGAPLYDVEAWVREPTQAELRTYLPRVPVGSWGLVACRTIPGNRVENCRTVAESPVGSGLATGVRRAAWQFQVLPPRVNGKPLIGVWVGIRIHITESGAAVRR